MPAFNEAARLPAVLSSLARVVPGAEVVVVNDGSKDRTTDVAREHGATVLELPFNLGYGAALQTGYKYALETGAEVVVQMDADGQHDPSEIPDLRAPIERGEADLVIGSRFLEPTDYEMGHARSMGRRLFQWMAGRAGLAVTDPTSGFQALNRTVLELYAGPFFPTDYPDVDVLLVAHRRGIRIREVSVHMKPETRKSTLHGGTRSFYYLYRLALSLWAGTNQRTS